MMPANSNSSQEGPRGPRGARPGTRPYRVLFFSIIFSYFMAPFFFKDKEYIGDRGSSSKQQAKGQQQKK